jgi:hypothetical protein
MVIPMVVKIVVARAPLRFQKLELCLFDLSVCCSKGSSSGLATEFLFSVAM